MGLRTDRRSRCAAECILSHARDRSDVRASSKAGAVSDGASRPHSRLLGAGLFGAGATTLGAVITAASALLGAGSAAGTLVIARASHSQPLLQDHDVATAELAGEKLRQLGAKAQ